MTKILKRVGVRSIAVGLSAGLAIGATPVFAAAPVKTGDIGGFATHAMASPLRIEVYEEALPIPVDPGKPQLEFDFAYSTVTADSGPSSSGRASAVWPGAALGDGLDTMLEQFGLPGDLFPDGYPVQSNAAFSGDADEDIDEPMPGMVQRVSATETRTVAAVGNSLTGQIPEGLPDEGAADSSSDGDTKTTSQNPLQSLLSGNWNIFGNLFGGTKTAQADSSNPFGMLSGLIDIDGMTSVSSTDYTNDKAVATATSRMGEIRLLGGLIKFSAVDVTTKVVGTVDKSIPSRQVNIGGMSILGIPINFGPDGMNLAGVKIPLPGMGNNAQDMIDKLGIGFEFPEPKVTQDGTNATVEADAMRITLNTKPFLSLFPKIPWGDIFEKIPMPEDSPDMLKMIVGMLPALLNAQPTIVMRIGTATATANTVAPFEFDFDEETGDTDGSASLVDDSGISTGDLSDLGDLGGGAGDIGSTGDAGVAADLGDLGGGAGDTGDLGSMDSGEPMADAGAPVGGEMTRAQMVAATPGLPDVGGLPTLLALLGLVIAAGAGRYAAVAGRGIFAASGACDHGLQSGVPDLRKV